MPSISVISPSIRPDGLKIVEETLMTQDFRDFDWHYRLSVPGPVPDLCRSFNSMLKEAKGELIVFLQDYIRIEPSGLRKMWEKYQEFPNAAFTAPVGKTLDWQNVEWEWRKHREQDSLLDYFQFEIDWASCPRSAIVEAGGFDEDFDSGFGWENVELAYRMHKLGLTYRVDPTNLAVAFDHDKVMEHPYKPRPNRDLWIGKQREIDGGRIKLGYLS